MARQSLAYQIWWMALTILAFNAIGVLLALGVASVTGHLDRDVFWDMIYVFRGTRVAVPYQDAKEYRALKAAAVEREEQRELEQGEGPVYADSLAAQQKVMEMMRQESDLLQGRLELERQKNVELRTTLESLKQELEEQRAILADEKEKKVIVAQAEKTQRLVKTFSNMDPGDIAVDITTLARGDEARQQYAAQLLGMMQPALVAEVLSEVPPEQRQVLLPAMDNPYASMAPEKVVSEWKRLNVSTRQMKEYIMRMPSSQALRVLRRLDRTTRDDVWELIAPIQLEAL